MIMLMTYWKALLLLIYVCKFDCQHLYQSQWITAMALYACVLASLAICLLYMATDMYVGISICMPFSLSIYLPVCIDRQGD